MNEFVKAWTEDIFKANTEPTIMVKFKNRDYEAEFPKSSFKELMWDKDVEYIYDSETGEILMESMF